MYLSPRVYLCVVYIMLVGVRSAHNWVKMKGCAHKRIYVYETKPALDAIIIYLNARLWVRE